MARHFAVSEVQHGIHPVKIRFILKYRRIGNKTVEEPPEILIFFIFKHLQSHADKNHEDFTVY
jgi:hypothetical protein